MFFRWKFIVPRLLLGSLAILFMLLATNPVVRYLVVHAVQRVTGAKVDLAEVRSNLRNGHVQMAGLAVADPYHPMKNLFEAELVDLQLDRRCLLRQQAVVRRGVLRGLDLGTERVESGAIDPGRVASYEADLAGSFDRSGKGWFEQAASQLRDGANLDLQSVRTANRVLQRWPEEYARIDDKANVLREKVAGLRTSLTESGINPLRNLETYQAAIAGLDGLGREIFEVRSQMDSVQQQIKMDHESLDAALAEDLKLLEQNVTFDLLDADSLSEYLLGPEVTERIENVLQWVRWTRRFSPTMSARRGGFAERGRDIHFPGTTPRADVLVDSLALQGKGRCGDEVVGLEGTISGLSSNPEYSGKPTKVVIQTVGDRPVLVQATFDGTTPTPHDTVTISIPHARQKGRLLGNARQLAVSTSPCHSNVWVNINIDGEALTGEMVVKQTGISLTPQLNPEFDSGQMAAAVHDSLAGTDSLDIAVALGGTLATPSWQLRSNIGTNLAQGLRDSVLRETVAKNEQYIREAHQSLKQQLQSVEQELLKRQQSILSCLEFGTTEIEEVRKDIATRVQSTDGVLDPESPLREAYRR